MEPADVFFREYVRVIPSLLTPCKREIYQGKILAVTKRRDWVRQVADIRRWGLAQLNTHQRAIADRRMRAASHKMDRCLAWRVIEGDSNNRSASIGQLKAVARVTI